jgi:hypothetical protein
VIESVERTKFKLNTTVENETINTRTKKGKENTASGIRKLCKK